MSDKQRKAQPKQGEPTESEQSRRFKEAARELGADQSEEAFNEALRKLARAPVRKETKGKAKKGASKA